MAKSHEKTTKEKHNSKSKEKHSKSKDKKISKKHKSKSKSKSKPNKHEISESENPLPTTTDDADSESESEFDREELRKLLGSYSKEQLVDLIYTTAEKGSKIVSAVNDAAERDVTLRKIFVHGLGWDTRRENLSTFFESYGEIEDCIVVMDKATGRAKGFGFVLFKTRMAAKKALKNPQKKMYNRTISCNLASERPGKEKETIAPVKISLSVGQQSQASAVSGQNVAFFGQHPGVSPALYTGMVGNPMLARALNYGVMGSGLVPTSHVGAVAGFGPGGGERAWYLE